MLLLDTIKFLILIDLNIILFSLLSTTRSIINVLGYYAKCKCNIEVQIKLYICTLAHIILEC